MNWKFKDGDVEHIFYARGFSKADATGGTDSMKEQWVDEYIMEIHSFLDSLGKFPRKGKILKNRPPPPEIRSFVKTQGKDRGVVVIYEVCADGSILVSGCRDWI